MKQRSLRGCIPMKRFLAPIACVIVGMAATLISSCARDAVDVPPDPISAPLPSAGNGYGSPRVDSQYLPPPGASQYGPSPAYGGPPVASQYSPPPSDPQYGSPPNAQGPLIVAPQYGQSPGASQYGQPPSYQYSPRS